MIRYVVVTLVLRSHVRHVGYLRSYLRTFGSRYSLGQVSKNIRYLTNNTTSSEIACHTKHFYLGPSRATQSQVVAMSIPNEALHKVR